MTETQPPIRRRGPYGKPLTKMQTTLLRLRADGHTMEEIAGFTGRTPRAVNDTFQRAYDRTGARNACGLVAMALRKGWIE